MTTRQLTQEEIDNAPEWATHYQIYDNDKDICFENDEFFQFSYDNKRIIGVRIVNMQGLDIDSLPIPAKTQSQ